MAEPEPRDDPEYMKNFHGFLNFDVTNTCFLEEDRDSNLEEESTKINSEICEDVFARKPQVKDSASCSAINEATKKTEASSSRNRDTSESGKIRRLGDKEDDRKESDDECDLYKRFHEIERFYDRFFGFSDHREEAENREIQSHEETCSLITQPSHQNPRLNLIATSGRQQLTRPNRGSTSSTSDRNKTSQLSPNAAPWSPHNTDQNRNRSESEMSQVIMPSRENLGLGHQNPRVSQISRSGSTSSTSDLNNIRKPIGMQSQLSPNAAPWSPNNNTYQQLPVANQMVKDSIMNPYQHSMADQHNFYQHLVADLEFWNAARGQPRSFAVLQDHVHKFACTILFDSRLLLSISPEDNPNQNNDQMLIDSATGKKITKVTARRIKNEFSSRPAYSLVELLAPQDSPTVKVGNQVVQTTEQSPPSDSAKEVLPVEKKINPSPMKLTVYVKPYEDDPRIIQVEVNADDNVEELRKELFKRQERGELDLPQERFYLVESAIPLSESKSFERNLVVDGDRIEIISELSSYICL
ncbi:Ubiquitin domain [Arabidopsis suecica]|uniref:Ubiquitin domain n=1 Tax=Arabidopsis suecica TaxID=45249 RepID=A0A8T1ZGJ2_ARASU|nr:Ubiquitin domain [Arabidopsis suecica]